MITSLVSKNITSAFISLWNINDGPSTSASDCGLARTSKKIIYSKIKMYMQTVVVIKHNLAFNLKF